MFGIGNKKRTDSLFAKLIQTNSGTSSRNFFLVCTTIIGMILLLVPAMVLIVEVLYQHTILTDLTGLAAYIGSVSTLFATAGLTKVWSSKFENQKTKKKESGSSLTEE